MNSLPKTVTRQRRDRLNPGPSAPESSTLTTRLLSHPVDILDIIRKGAPAILIRQHCMRMLWPIAADRGTTEWTTACYGVSQNSIPLVVLLNAFIALTPLVWRQEGHPACKKTEWWGAGMVVCLERVADLHRPS